MSAQLVAWRDVEPGSVVKLKGNDWRVERVKVKGKIARVRVSGPLGTFERELKAKDRVKIVDGHVAGGPLRDAKGAQRRWATADEAERDAPPALGLPGGRHGASPKPETGKGPRWDAPATDPAGVAVETILGARLIAETPDEPAGYFVPLPDVTTIRAHLAIFHGIPAHEQPADEGNALAAHRVAHDEGAAFAVNHWHTKRRPGRLDEKG